MSHHLQVGNQAPDFTLFNQKDEAVRLSDYIGKKVIVLFFYPKDNSVGCTAEACAFRDSYEAFTDAGAEVIGISEGSTADKEFFARKNRLPFLLLNDPDRAVAEQYDVTISLGIFRERKTFVIDRSGIVRHIFASQLNMNKHMTEALEVVRQLQTAAV